MKRLTITVLVAGLFAGSLFASENNKMMVMDKEKCALMYKSMHQDLKKDNVSNELTIFEKHQKILNPERDELYGG